MSQSFSIARARCAVLSDPALREEIQSRTLNETATSRILSSIERFGADPSIQRYEIVPSTQVRVSRVTGTKAWTVRAVR